MPWEFYLGNASHRLIAYIYSTRHPANRVLYNKKSIRSIIDAARVGDASRLLDKELNLRPDIVDITLRYLFEIKPFNERGLLEGIKKAGLYLQVLNRAMPPDNQFSGGMDFEGEILTQFAQGQHIWRLEWCTTAPGVTQYRWTRSQERFNSNAAAHKAGLWVELSQQELDQYGSWVAQAVEGMVERREMIAAVSGALGVVIDMVGEAAVVALSAASPGQRSSTPTAGQSPAPHAVGKVLPLPSKPPPSAPAVKPSKASGM